MPFFFIQHIPQTSQYCLSLGACVCIPRLPWGWLLGPSLPSPTASRPCLATTFCCAVGQAQDAWLLCVGRRVILYAMNSSSESLWQVVWFAGLFCFLLKLLFLLKFVASGTQREWRPLPLLKIWSSASGGTPWGVKFLSDTSLLTFFFSCVPLLLSRRLIEFLTFLLLERRKTMELALC